MGGNVIRGGLFSRFLLRFLIGLGVASLVFAPLVHLFQRRVVDAEWEKDLRQEAVWAARHMHPGEGVMYANAWRSMHSTVRVTFFDEEGKLISDSHPERALPDFDALQRGETPLDYLAAIEEFPHGGWLVVSRPGVPIFPFGMHWELVVASVLVVVVGYLLLYPLVRSISTTLEQLGQLAKEVASGHFGKTLSVARSDELGALVGSFNDMSRKLAEAEQSNARLLHDVSHELRSPLGRIQVMAETSILRPEESEECIRGIGQEIKLLDRLVDDLLQVARLESDSHSPHVEVFSLFKWAEETSRRLGSKVRSRGVSWTTRLPEADCQLRGDPQRLDQALGNLVDNAIHALEGQDDPRIDLEISVAEQGWSLTVSDNGPGIPAADLSQVFRRFYRVGDDRSRDRGGVGLGLSLVQAIAEAHGGKATIQSDPDSGTRVTLSMPATAA